MLAGGSALSGDAPTSLLPPYMKPPLPPVINYLNNGGSLPGFTPPAPAAPAPQNPQNLLTQDPAYLQAKSDYDAALAAAAASRDASTNRALVQFGVVPDFASIGKGLGLSDAQIKAITGELNPETGALANQYTASGNSVIGQLNRAHDLALKQLKASLAARGVLESGATGVGVGQENQNLQQGMSNAYQQLIDNLLGYQNDYAGAAGTARSNLENSLSAAYDRAIQMAQQMPGYGSSEPGGAVSAPAVGSAPPPGYAPIGSTVAPSAAPNTYDVGGVQIKPPTVRIAPKPKPIIADPYATTRKTYR